MPSGAKKRKAARKKKEKENNNINPSSTNNPPQANDELKSQDEKGSDGGEGISPSYNEHGDQHDPFNGGSEEVEDRDPSASRPFASDVKSVEEVPGAVKIDHVLGGKEDNVVMIERDLKSKESYERKDEIFEHVETAKASCYESGNGGGASNGESLTRENSKDENYNSHGEAIPSHELVKSDDSTSSKMTLITKSVPIEPEETGANSAAEYSVNTVKAVASVCEVENRDTGSVLLEKSKVPPLVAANLTVKTTEDNAYPSTDENATTLTLEEPKPKECDSKVLTSLSPCPPTKVTNGAEHVKNSETPECSENQPRVTSAPNMVQKTSWWSCCGLFEVLSGSDR